MRKLFNIPEISLMGLGLFWITENYLASGRISYVALLVTWLLFLQVFYKNRICGIIYGVSLTIISAYKFYDNFQTVVQESSQSLINGSSILFGIGFIMSAVMFVKYLSAKERYEQSVLTISNYDAS
jgi:hypothetical protein